VFRFAEQGGSRSKSQKRRAVGVLDGLDVVFIPTVAKVIHAFDEVDATGSAKPDCH
jgi:hypothetical protein